MEKLYYKNQYLKEFSARVLKVEKVNDEYHVVLDKTAFFPGGGGQLCDLGYIDNKKVLKVYENNKTIYHVLDGEVNTGSNVLCSIDWDRREDGMHQHLGQHILSGCFYKLFNSNTVSIHLGKEISTVDIVGVLNEEKIREAESFANEVIRNNIDVEFLVPSKEELSSINLRRDLPNTEDEIRVVKIGNLDINACCGVHPSKTSDLKMIKIKKFEKNKGNTRIEFLAGNRAIKDSLNKDNILREICNYLSSNEEEALSGIKNIKALLEEVKIEKKKLEEELLNYEAKSLLENNNSNKIIIKNIFKDKSVEYVTKLANRLCERENVVCLFAINNKEKSNIILASSKNIDNLNMGEIFREFSNIVNGKGGGSKNLAQGIAKENNIEEFLSKIYEFCCNRM